MSTDGRPRTANPAAPAVWLIGYGSLMSGLGLAPLGRVRARAAVRVAIHNARRGFGKFSQHGDRFALVMEARDRDRPIVAQALPPDTASGAACEGLALRIGLADLMRVSAREGYESWAVRRLHETAARDGYDLATSLWRLYAAEQFDLSAFRRRLFATAGYTSPHYVPHPVPLDGETGLTFVAPGREGCGCDTVVPVRVRTGHLRLLTLSEVWRLKPNRSQLDYAVACLLGAVHGIRVADLLVGLRENGSLRARVAEAVAAEQPREPSRFRAATGLSEAAYGAAFGRPEHALQRAGLAALVRACD